MVTSAHEVRVVRDTVCVEMGCRSSCTLPPLQLFATYIKHDGSIDGRDMLHGHRCLSCPVGCPSRPPRFTGTPDTSANGVALVWDEPHIMDPLILDPRYAVYSMCEGDATLALQVDELQSSSYTISSLPAGTQCTALVVLYSRHCAANTTGPLVGTVIFSTAAKCEWLW